MYRHSVKGLYRFDGIKSLAGTLNELSAPTEVPEAQVIKCLNFKPHKDGISRVKRPGYSKFDAFYNFEGLPIRGLFDYWDETPVNRYEVITSKKIFSRAVGAGSWSELYSQTAELEFPIKPVVYLRERPIVVGFDTNRLVEPTTTYGLGIVAPTSAPTLAEGTGGALTGTFKGVVTYMRSGNFQVESNPSPISSPVGPITAKKINWSNIPVSSDPKVDKKRLYRTTADGAVFFWVADIANATTTYEDNITELGDEVSYDRYPPPVAIFAEVWDDRVWFVPKSDRNQLHFTNKGSAEEMDSDNIIQVKGKDSDEIMAIKAYMDSLYIFKHKSPWRLDKIGESSYQLTKLPYNIGTDAPASVAVGGGLLMWKSKRGIEIFNDQVIFDPPFSDLIPETLATINEAAIGKAFGEVNEKEGEYWLAVPTGASTEPDLVIVYDYIGGKISRYIFTKKLTAMHNIRDGNSKLQFITGSSDGNLYIQDSGFTDDGTPITANFMTKQYCCLTNEKGLWNVLRRLFVDYICPTGTSVVLKIYKNKEKVATVSTSLAGVTPSDSDKAREVILRRINLGLSCAYVCFEFSHNETPTDEVRILPPEIYFKRRVWKSDVKAD
jgi:hypothetical protein